MRLKYDSVAQPVEHNTFNVGVLGSNPSGITKGLTMWGLFAFLPIKTALFAKKHIRFNQVLPRFEGTCEGTKSNS